MKRHLAIVLTILLASIGWVSRADAQRREAVVTESGPNRALLSSGLFAFGASYLTSVIVASESNHQGDNHLYVPIAGPWMDLADRGDCGHFGQPACDTETAYKVLIIVDGVFQGIGALDIVGAFLFPETRVVRVSKTSPRVVVTPTPMGRSGYGFSALATF
jgi:hypothetical protein